MAPVIMAAVAEKAARSQMLSDAPPKRILCQGLRGDGSGSFVGSRIRRILFPGGVTDFTAVTDGQINLTPNETAMKAARDAINGWDPTGGCLYFYNPRGTDDTWIRTRTVKTL